MSHGVKVYRGEHKIDKEKFKRTVETVCKKIAEYEARLGGQNGRNKR